MPLLTVAALLPGLLLPTRSWVGQPRALVVARAKAPSDLELIRLINEGKARNLGDAVNVWQRQEAGQKPAVKVEDQQAKRISQFGGRDLFSRLQITKALGGNPRAAPFVKAASKYLAGQHYIVENPAWAPFAPAAAGAAGALRKHVVEWWERGEEGIAAGALEMFCKRSEAPALYEYVGKYAPVPAGEIVERESAAAFSPQRRKALYDCLINLHFSPERANAFIDGEDTWELRPIKFVAYDEGLYGALQRAAR